MVALFLNFRAVMGLTLEGHDIRARKKKQFCIGDGANFARLVDKASIILRGR